MPRDHGEPTVSLPQRIVAIHVALEDAGIPHAFGGALALAWCTQQARGTIDIDCNVFVVPSTAPGVLDALPTGVVWGPKDVAAIERDGQVRLWWDRTPVDLFFNTTPFHEAMAEVGTLDLAFVVGAIVDLLGPDDDRVERLRSLRQ